MRTPASLKAAGLTCVAATAGILAGCTGSSGGTDSPASLTVSSVTSPGSPAAEATTTAPIVGFAGHVDCGPPVRTGTDDTVPGGGPVRLQSRGWAWQPSGTMTDPRLQGDYFMTYDSDDYRDPAGIQVGSGTWRIENDDGAWQGSFTNVHNPDSTTVVSTPLVGEGAYDGLTAIWESTSLEPGSCAWDVRGVVLGARVPATPEPYRAP